MRSHPTSAGRLCVRGWQVGDLVTSARQLTQPLVRRDGQLVPCSYQDALAAAAGFLGEARGGKIPTWLLGAAHLTNEDAFAAACFAADVMGTPYRGCPARAVDDAVICRLQQILRTPYLHPPLGSLAERDVILVLHSSLDTQHPQANAWTLEAETNGAKLIVLDEVCGDLARVADVYVQLGPDGLQDALTALVRGARGETDASDKGALGEALELLVGAERPAIVASAAALPAPSVAALAGTLAAALVGDDDAANAVFLMRSESNSLGTAVMGLTPEGDAETNLHQLLGDDRSLAATVIVDDDLTQFVGLDGFERLRPKLGRLIVLSAFPSPTVDLADVVLPMATIGQQESTVTSGAGRVWLMDALIDPPGEARSAVQTLADLAGRMGGSVVGPEPAQVWRQVRAQVPACADVDLEALQAGGEVLLRRDELALMLPPLDDFPAASALEDDGEEKSLVLIVRRDQNDRAFDPRVPSMALLERDMLRARVPYIWHSRDEMVERRIRPGQPVQITTRFGSAEVPAQSLDGAPDGLIVLPYHLGDLRHTLAGPGEPEACGGRSWRALRAELTAP